MPDSRHKAFCGAKSLSRFSRRFSSSVMESDRPEVENSISSRQACRCPRVREVKAAAIPGGGARRSWIVSAIATLQRPHHTAPHQMPTRPIVSTYTGYPAAVLYCVLLHHPTSHQRLQQSGTASRLVTCWNADQLRREWYIDTGITFGRTLQCAYPVSCDMLSNVARFSLAVTSGSKMLLHHLFSSAYNQLRHLT